LASWARNRNCFFKERSDALQPYWVEAFDGWEKSRNGDVVMIDARTGFIYGAVGDTGTSYGVALTLLESEFVKQSGKSRATDSARKQLVKRYPAFLGERQSSARALNNFRNVAHFLLAMKQ
jgi:hypothetical protein